jgi:hypothetical protein
VAPTPESIDSSTSWRGRAPAPLLHGEPGYSQTTAMMNPVSELILGLYGGMHARLLAWLPCGSTSPS